MHAPDQSKQGGGRRDTGEGEKVVAPPRKRHLPPCAKIFFFLAGTGARSPDHNRMYETRITTILE